MSMLSKWRDAAGEMSWQVALLRGAMGRMHNRVLSMSWEKWQHEAAETSTSAPCCKER